MSHPITAAPTGVLHRRLRQATARASVGVDWFVAMAAWTIWTAWGKFSFTSMAGALFIEYSRTAPSLAFCTLHSKWWSAVGHRMSLIHLVNCKGFPSCARWPSNIVTSRRSPSSFPICFICRWSGWLSCYSSWLSHSFPLADHQHFVDQSLVRVVTHFQAHLRAACTRFALESADPDGWTTDLATLLSTALSGWQSMELHAQFQVVTAAAGEGASGGRSWGSDLLR